MLSFRISCRPCIVWKEVEEDERITSVEHKASIQALPSISTECHQPNNCKWLEETCFSQEAISYTDFSLGPIPFFHDFYFGK